MEDKIIYRQANDGDIERINAFYNKVYHKNRTTSQFNWEFNSSPAGRAIYIIAEYRGAVVGTQCAIPYYCMTYDNQEILSAKSEDTLVSRDFRGQNIFENMYTLLIEECKKKAIVFLWGFTYAEKPFRKIGFTIPYKAEMGILALRPIKSANYFYSITGSKKTLTYFKILGLTSFSYLKNAFAFSHSRKITLSFGPLALNAPGFNYLQQEDLFGLKLDQPFMDYRLYHNPHSSAYKCVYWRENDELKASLHFNVTADGVGYIIHLYVSSSLSLAEGSAFLRKAIANSDLKDSVTVRFWGFSHNSQNATEVNVLKKARFVFLKRGISFVGLDMNADRPTDYRKFVLSRMASQGTD